MKFLLWAQVLEQVVFFLLAARYLRLPGEWFWWFSFGFWILAGLALLALSAGRAVSRKITAGTPRSRFSEPSARVPAGKEE